MNTQHTNRVIKTMMGRSRTRVGVVTIMLYPHMVDKVMDEGHVMGDVVDTRITWVSIVGSTCTCTTFFSSSHCDTV